MPKLINKYFRTIVSVEPTEKTKDYESWIWRKDYEGFMGVISIYESQSVAKGQHFIVVLERRILHVQRGVKVVNKRDGVELLDGSTEVKVGKLKSTTIKRDISLNDTAMKMIQELRKEFYFGEDSPLIRDEKGNHTKPDVFRRRYHRLLEGAGIESKGLHSLRHTFATKLVNGVKQPDGTVKALTVKQVADLLGHSTTQVTEMYYVKKDTSMLNGITNDFCL